MGLSSCPPVMQPEYRSLPKAPVPMRSADPFPHGSQRSPRAPSRAPSVRGRSLSGVAALVAVMALVGCRKTPQGEAVASLSVEGNRALGESYIRERIATVRAPKFLGFFYVSWLRYEPFEPAVLERDLERIERTYQRLGYYEAHVRV